MYYIDYIRLIQRNKIISIGIDIIDLAIHIRIVL